MNHTLVEVQGRIVDAERPFAFAAGFVSGPRVVSRAIAQARSNGYDTFTCKRAPGTARVDIRAEKLQGAPSPGYRIMVTLYTDAKHDVDAIARAYASICPPVAPFIA